MNSLGELSDASPKTQGRKLIQGRLPFAVVDHKTHSTPENTGDDKEKVVQTSPSKPPLHSSSYCEDKGFDASSCNSPVDIDQNINNSIDLVIENDTPTKAEHLKKKKEEKMKEKEVREQKKAEEKAIKEQLKKEKEEEKKKKSELKEIERKRKEEEKKRKEEEKEADKKRKDEERKKKEEEKEAEKKRKEEEKKRKEEEKENEKRKKEEEERRKKERLSQVFTNFFTQKKTTSAKMESKENMQILAFAPFQVKDSMKLAPLLRTEFDEDKKKELDKFLKEESNMSCKTILDWKSYVGRKSGPTWPLTRGNDADNLVEIIEEDEDPFVNKQEVIRLIPISCQRRHPKLLQFCENRRPAYWGTWRKKSENITPRRPFGRDKIFDYDVDSDEEWEEVEPGESLTDSEGEDKEPVDDYEVDNDFLVPHGYLSEEEGENDEDDKPFSPSAAKEQLKFKQEQFVRELKEKTHHLKPSLIGCCWSNSLLEIPQSFKVLKKYAAVIVSGHSSISLALNDLNLDENSPNLEDMRSDNKTSKKSISEEEMPVLLQILHGSTFSKVTIVKEFQMYLDQTKGDENKIVPSKAKILSKIAEVACWGKCSEPGPMNGRLCWLVHSDALQQYNLQNLPVINSWEFSTDTKKRGRTKTDDAKPEEDTPPAKTPRISLVRKFTDSIQTSCNDNAPMPKVTSELLGGVNISSVCTPKAKKRIALISMPTSASKKIKSETKSTPLTTFLKRVMTKECPTKANEDIEEMDGIEILDNP